MELCSNYTSIGPARPMDPEFNRSMWKCIDQSKLSDAVELDHVQDELLSSFWTKNSDFAEWVNYAVVPSDILTSGHLAMKDCRIVIKDDRGILTARVVIFDDYKDRMDDMLSVNGAMSNVLDKGHVVGSIVGGMVVYTNESVPPDLAKKCSGEFAEVSMILPIICMPTLAASGNIMYLMATTGEYSFRSIDKAGIKHLEDAFARQTLNTIDSSRLHQVFIEIMAPWYGLQVLWLHPRKDVIIREGRETLPQKAVNPKHKNKKRNTIKYIRRIYINTKELQTPIKQDRSHEQTRRTMLWYVIGHWREYRNGKRTFIQGYWKGPMRDLKSAEPDVRKREPDLEAIPE